MDTQDYKFDDSQLALRIAVRSAILTTALYALLFAFSQAVPFFRGIPFFEPVTKVFLVIGALMAADKYIRDSRQTSNPENFPFLSTIFFYGMTLLFVYLAQIWYLIAQTVMGNPSSFLDKLEFLIGIESLSTKAIISSFIAGHLPFIAYYVTLSKHIKKHLN